MIILCAVPGSGQSFALDHKSDLSLNTYRGSIRRVTEQRSSVCYLCIAHILLDFTFLCQAASS